MSDQVTTTHADLASLSDIEAEVAWTISNRPPEIELSFEGLHEPFDLWTKLTDIGWVVPAMPPRPANAIVWTPDPVAGTDFTVLPWRVTDFRLDQGAWTVDVDKVGDKTLDALLDSGAKIVGSSDQIAEHSKMYQLRKAHQERAAANPINSGAPLPVPDALPVRNPVADTDALLSKPTPAPATTPEAPVITAAARTEVPLLPDSKKGSRFILLLNFPREHDPIPDAGTWNGISGRQRTVSTWSELSLPQDQPIPGHENMAGQVANGAGAWYFDTGEPIASDPGRGKRIVRLFVPDLKVNDAKIRRMNKLLGEDIETHQLRSLIGGEATAVFVSATVDANSFEMLKSNLSLRLPKAVVRVSA